MAGKYNTDSSVVPGLSDSGLEPLRLLFEFVNPTEITAYLGEHPLLIAFLPQAHAAIRGWFADAPLALEVRFVRDVEQTLLVLFIYSKDDTSSTMIKFNDLKLKWWHFAENQFGDEITISIEHPEVGSSLDPWDAWENMMGKYDGPEDWSAEHDHYLYGSPKRFQNETQE